ncbi:MULTISPECIES: PDR/VanB family oxidoreductase [unclassified Geodermatophilus]|uniref:PDR/VanB family oxidoreductase n=1 Tax=unclassified Geodermatophilus TaxID=2637632 RepID=UPI003EEF455A
MERNLAGEAGQHVLRVQQKTWEADGITSVTLVDPSGAALPTWKPGAHLALHLPNGLVREYSLCSDPHDSRRWTVAVLRTADSRGGSSYIHDSLPVGVHIVVDGPRNAFHLEDGPKHFLIAGGIGITPILPMVRELEARGAEWSLLYTGRSRQTMAFLPAVDQLPRERRHVHVDDESGRYPDLKAMLHSQDPRTLVYCCGPTPLMDAVAEGMEDPNLLRLERFKAPERELPPGTVDEAFDVVLNSTGERIPVGPDESVLEALEAAGVDVPSSCAEGICGTCETTVLSGEVDHRDFLLTPEEHEAAGTMMVCVSRCRGRELVLEL